MKRNDTMMQFFEWHVPADGCHWQRLKHAAPQLKAVGINAVWLPPVSKGQSANDNGYGIYDGYDLGEFNQKGTVRTKYGTKQELLEAIEVCRHEEIRVYIDIVMNHRAGADETELFDVVEVDPENRMNELSKPFEIEGWTKFTFPGRNQQYSSFTWNTHHFNGTDYDERTKKIGIYRLLGEHKGWSKNVVDELGNYDYLMFANIDYDILEVRHEMISWAKWVIDTLKCDGFRLDAVKHINRDFMNEWLQAVHSYTRKRFYIVGEFWQADAHILQHYLKQTNYQLNLFDVALHYKFYDAAKAGADFDLRTIFHQTLVQSHPSHAVTFVDNHDSQPYESLQSWVLDWFKPLAYALILLRRSGRPCVFFGDYYGIHGPVPIQGKQEMLDSLLYARYEKAYGKQKDYFDNPHAIGWVRFGKPSIQKSGCAVILSNDKATEKRMFVGKQRAGEVWVDLTDAHPAKITIEKDGFATFPVQAKSVSVWALN
ncbi:alpha-amylase [Peribacillus asahii]|uniref:alpha-amylase n=1 Tax=Peribacillus asahii TaxID=228899 RepID=UPI00207AE39A|nr:alpha-amylase [Peribacillus asahii]USK70253.1 alpha-amylase [Peribacillus asahii]